MTNEPNDTHEHTLACGCNATLAPGWAALEKALIAEHGCEPIYFNASPESANECPVESVACFRVEGPAPHWLFVTCGLTELYDKQFMNPEVSGFGFELTLRVPADDGDEPPRWPMALLRNLALYVGMEGRPFAEGQHLNAHAPLALDVPCTLTAVCFVADPTMDTVVTPNGRMNFLQAFGLTDDELEAVMDGDGLDFIALIAQRNPLFLCDPGRISYLEDDEVALQIQDRIDSDGSTAEGSFAADLRFEEEEGELVIHLGAMHARALTRGLRHRIPFEREYALRGREGTLLLAPSSSCGWHADDRTATLLLAPEASRALGEAIRPSRGRYDAASVPRVVVEIHPTELTDDDGQVVNVIG